MLSEHAFHTATQLPDGRVLVAGGLINDRLDGQPSRAAEIYDPDRGTWTATGTMIDARWRHTATLLADGTVLVMGGNAGRLDSAEVYDPATGRWSPTGRLTARRAGHTATLLPDGTVLVVGGGDEDTTMEGGPRSRTAERYDPKTGQWSATGRLIEARTGFTATLLRDGLVLVAGGDGGFMAAERYDPAAATWAVTGPMTEGRHGHTATLLADGTVLVAGGCACSEPGAIATAELYRPDAGSWTPTGAMGTPRIFHTATLLSDGTVLVVADGVDMGGRPSAERYDPGRGRWSPTASPIHARFGDTATLLADGRVLVAGGYEPDTQSFAEVYDPGSGS